MKNLKIIEDDPEMLSNPKILYTYIGVSYYFLGEKDQSVTYMIKAIRYFEKPIPEVIDFLNDVSTRDKMLDNIINEINKSKKTKDKAIELDLAKIREKSKNCLIF